MLKPVKADKALDPGDQNQKGNSKIRKRKFIPKGNKSLPDKNRGPLVNQKLKPID